MRIVLNIIWLVLAGFWETVAWCLAGLLIIILIVTIPFGLQAFKIASFTIWPFGRTLVKRPAMADHEQARAVDPTASMTTGAPVPVDGKIVHQGNSAVQRAAKPSMLAAVAQTIGVPLAKKRLPLAEGVARAVA